MHSMATSFLIYSLPPAQHCVQVCFQHFLFFLGFLPSSMYNIYQIQLNSNAADCSFSSKPTQVLFQLPKKQKWVALEGLVLETWITEDRLVEKEEWWGGRENVSRTKERMRVRAVASDEIRAAITGRSLCCRGSSEGANKSATLDSCNKFTSVQPTLQMRRALFSDCMITAQYSVYTSACAYIYTLYHRTRRLDPLKGCRNRKIIKKIH